MSAESKQAKQIMLHTQKLSEPMAERLYEAGFIAIRVRETSDVRVINAEPPALSGDAILTALLKAMKVGNAEGYNAREKVMDTFLGDLLVSMAKKSEPNL